MNRIKHILVFIILYPLLAFMRILPLSWAESVGRICIGAIGPKTSKQKRVLNGLRIAFPNLSDESLTRLAYKNWQHYGINLAHAIHVDNPNLIQRTDVEGWHHLQTAYEQGKGVFILSAHLGVWEVICATIGHRLAPLDTVYRPIDNPYLNAWFVKRRLRVYKSLIKKGPSAGKKILKSIRSGGIVPMMSDQKMWGGVRVPYFRVPAETASGIVVLGAKLDAPVIPIYAVYTDSHRYKMVIHPPMSLTGNEEYDALQMNQMFERWVEQYPHQYFTFTHNRWQ